MESLCNSVADGGIAETQQHLEHEVSLTQHLDHATVSCKPSVELLELLTRYGYDPDRPGAQNLGERGRRLIDYDRVLKNDDVVSEPRMSLCMHLSGV